MILTSTEPNIFRMLFSIKKSKIYDVVSLLYLWLAKKPVLSMKYWHGWNAWKWFFLFFTDKRQCPIFRLGDIVRLAQGNFTKLSIKGGVIGVYITWNCDLDWSFDDYCLPTYSFRILDTFGWNFRHAHYHEENRRTLVKAYGLKFLVVVDGRASKFDLKNTVIVLVTGLGLLGLSTMFCDFILLNYSTDRRRVRFMFIFQKNLDFFLTGMEQFYTLKN